MTIEEGLYSRLQAVAGVTALVSTRVYPLLVPQEASLPAIAYQRISGPRETAHDGPSGLAFARMQVTCIGSSYSSAKGVSEAVRAALDGQSGTWGSTVVGACFLDDESDIWSTVFEKPVVRADYLIWYQE